MNSREELRLAKEAMLRSMAELEAMEQRYERFPSDEQFENGTILRFTRTTETYQSAGKTVYVYNDGVLTPEDNFTPGGIVEIRHAEVPTTTSYIYVALKAGDRWFITGSSVPMRNGMSWDELIDLLLEWKVEGLEVFDQLVDSIINLVP